MMAWQIVEDIPAESPVFSFGSLAKSLVHILQQPRSRAFVLGLHGPWGSGKTTLLNAIRTEVQIGEPSAKIVEFNAWKYEQRETLWRALILRLLDALRDIGGAADEVEKLERSLYEAFTEKERGRIQINWGAAITEALLMVLSLSGLGIGGVLVGGFAQKVRNWFGLEADGKEKHKEVSERVDRLSGILKREIVERSIRQVVSIEQFLKMFQDILSKIARERRIYILVDDLDRCLPETALEILEAIKLFLDAPQCAYVIAVDRGVIRRGLDIRYPSRTEIILPPIVNPDEYVEKMISLSFDLPVLAREDALSVLSTCGLPHSLDQLQLANIVKVLGSNPRRLKRFGASLSVWMNVAMEIPADSLAFHPLQPGNIKLFLKLALIGYINSGVFAQMIDDPGLAERLQQAANAAANEPRAPEAAKVRVNMLVDELPIIRAASLEPALWRAITLLEPDLANEPRLAPALRWFRTPAQGRARESA